MWVVAMARGTDAGSATDRCRMPALHNAPLCALRILDEGLVGALHTPLCGRLRLHLQIRARHTRLSCFPHADASRTLTSRSVSVCPRRSHAQRGS